MHDGDRAGDHPDELHVVLHHDEGVGAVDLADELGGARHLVVRHAGGRLVEQDQLGVPGQHGAELDPLPQPVGQPADRSARQRREADPLEDLLGDRARPLGRVRAAGGQPEVLANREAVEEARDLGLDADASPRDGVGVMTGDVVPPEHDAPGRRLELPGEKLEQRALAGPVGPDETA